MRLCVYGYARARLCVRVYACDYVCACVNVHVSMCLCVHGDRQVEVPGDLVQVRRHAREEPRPLRKVLETPETQL